MSKSTPTGSKAKKSPVGVKKSGAKVGKKPKSTKNADVAEKPEVETIETPAESPTPPASPISSDAPAPPTASKSPKSPKSPKSAKAAGAKPYEKFDYKTAMERTVFVGNVPYRVERKALAKIFKPFGKIEAVYKRSLLQKTEKLTKKMLGTDEKLKAAAKDAHFYVRFADEEGAQNACSLNATTFEGRYLRVTMSNDHSTDPKRSVFVGNLLYVAGEQKLMEFFMEKVGDCEGVHIVRDRQTGLGLGYGLATFKTAEAARKALALNGEKWKGRPLNVTKIAAKKKNRMVVQPGGAKLKAKAAKKQRNQHDLNQKLANYVITKKSAFGHKTALKKKHGQPDPKPQLSKKVKKEIRKRKAKKSGGLLG
ncbi:nucleolin [Aphelenchoides fujianensis]|nr:nucleolin [Aphelenchoides fujianensis]